MTLLTPPATDRLLRSTVPEHTFLSDLQEKSDFFDQAATKYTAKVVAQ